jgi:hypothetical protein
MRNFDVWKTERDRAYDVDGLLKVLTIDNHLMVWKPKALRPYVNLLFRDSDAVGKYLARCIMSAKQHKDLVAERKAARKVSPDQMDNVKLGDIFHWSWGYDQTNCDFFQVTKKIGKTMVELRSIGAKTVDSKGYSDMSCLLIAEKNNFLTGRFAKTFTKRISFNNGVPYVSMEFGWCDRWDGKPEYCSWYA